MLLRPNSPVPLTFLPPLAKHAGLQARCSLSGQEVVLKAYTLSKMDDLQRVQLYREVQLHSRLEHPNVVQLYATFMVGSDGAACVWCSALSPGGAACEVALGCRATRRPACHMVAWHNRCPRSACCCWTAAGGHQMLWSAHTGACPDAHHVTT